MQVTTFVPHGKTEPDGGVQMTTTFVLQSSVAETVKFTTAPAALLPCTVMLVEQNMFGGAESTTVTVWVQVAMLVQQSTACQIPCQTFWQAVWEIKLEAASDTVTLLQQAS